MFMPGEHTQKYGDTMMDFSQSMDDQFSPHNPLPLSMKADTAESKNNPWFRIHACLKLELRVRPWKRTSMQNLGHPKG